MYQVQTLLELCYSFYFRFYLLMAAQAVFLLPFSRNRPYSVIVDILSKDNALSPCGEQQCHFADVYMFLKHNHQSKKFFSESLII